MSETDKVAILEALKSVQDPDLGRDIVPLEIRALIAGTSLGGQREFNHGDLSLARCSVRSRDGECVKTTSFTRCHPL